ncbi:MAG TPA: galactokinase family protein [Solirubrobacteraceae bacterium]|nr:galactokinase family protein [Solirubrobacteraceae bacterium]
MPPERAAAFAPGRVNVIGEHTDYNQGLALPFAIAEGVTVRARADGTRPPRIRAQASDLGEHDEFPLEQPARAAGWRAFARGTVAELAAAGFPLVGAELEISGQVPPGSGLSSSAALEVALALALIELGDRGAPGEALARADRTELARVCSRVENEWVGARTGLLDQLASLYGAPDTALCIDFRSLSVAPVALELGDWRFVVLDSGERHVHAGSGYNERRAECARACELLGVSSLREADARSIATLPQPLRRRAEHVLGENQRVLDAVRALSSGDVGALGGLLDASHVSLRELYEVSTPAVEAAVARLHDAGAAGARPVGGGFGGIVLGLFAPGVRPPHDAREVRPSVGAHLLER